MNMLLKFLEPAATPGTCVYSFSVLPTVDLFLQVFVMGSEQSKTTERIKKYKEEDVSTTFSNQPFAYGRFRKVYEGTWQKPPERKGRKCVLKKRMDTYTWKHSDWDCALKIVAKAQELAAGFNPGANRPIHFADVETTRVISRDKSSSYKLNEYLIAENYLHGNFKKWCNNYGFISEEASTTAFSLPAFMHWSWVKSKGQLMIADLQGVKEESAYFLTDPVILSLSKEYGPTDMGVEGMAMFFITHECNDICKSFPRPSLGDIRYNPHVPQQLIEKCIMIRQREAGSTMYYCELQLDSSSQMALQEIFAEIAT